MRGCECMLGCTCVSVGGGSGFGVSVCVCVCVCVCVRMCSHAYICVHAHLTQRNQVTEKSVDFFNFFLTACIHHLQVNTTIMPFLALEDVTAL